MINDGGSCLTLPLFLGKHEKTGVAKNNRELVTRESAHLGIHKKDTAEETEVDGMSVLVTAEEDGPRPPDCIPFGNVAVEGEGRIASKIKSPKGRKKREKRIF